MNYYLARDGKTYGPYPQEYIPAMVQQGQLVPDDLLCPEGGNDWTPLSQLPQLMSAAPAAAPAAAGNRLRMSTGTATHAPAANVPTPAYTPAPQRTGTMQKVGGAWGALKVVGYAVVALIVVGGAIGGFIASQRDKKEIAKLHSQPGWNAFNTANQQINSESSTEGYGSSGEIALMSKKFAEALEAAQRESFKVERSTRYRGRSKIGRITSAVSSAKAGQGHFQTFIDLRKDRVLVLIHVPDFKLYKGEAREGITEMCWEISRLAFSEAQKVEESMLTLASGVMPGVTNRALPGRTAPNRTVPSRPPTPRPAGALAASAPPPKVEPKLKKNMPLVVGVRGKSDYECVFVGSLSTPEDSPPAPTKKNVPSHQLLVKWFGEEKPE